MHFFALYELIFYEFVCMCCDAEKIYQSIQIRKGVFGPIKSILFLPKFHLFPFLFF